MRRTVRQGTVVGTGIGTALQVCSLLVLSPVGKRAACNPETLQVVGSKRSNPESGHHMIVGSGMSVLCLRMVVVVVCSSM